MADTMRILVTGGAGFIGSNTVDALVAAKADEVAGIDDLSSGNRHQVDASLLYTSPSPRD